jgi:invasion protein IalB
VPQVSCSDVLQSVTSEAAIANADLHRRAASADVDLLATLKPICYMDVSSCQDNPGTGEFMVLGRALALAFSCMIAGALVPNPAHSQEAPATRWSSQCIAPDLSSPLACTVEQRVVLRETGQQVARFSVQIAGAKGERKPAFLVQLPLGLSIRAGIVLMIDDKEIRKLEIQTCDAAGCYGGDPLDEALMKEMNAGKTMTIEFNDLQNKAIGIQIDLAGFGTVLEKVM